MFCQGSSCLSDFHQSLHIFPGDLLVTSCWLSDDNWPWHGCISWSLPLCTFFIPGILQVFHFLVYVQPPHILWGHIMLIFLGPRNLLDWKEQMNRGNIRPVFGVLGPSLPGLGEGSLYSVQRMWTCLLLGFDFRLVVKCRTCLFVLVG